MITPEFMLDVLKVGGVPALSIIVVIAVWMRQGPDRKVIAEDALNAEISTLRSLLQSHDVRIAVIETTLKERSRS